MAKILQTLQNGSLRDLTGNNPAGILTPGNGGFRNTGRGQAMLFDSANTDIVFSDIEALQNIFTGGGTARIWIYPFSDGEGGFGRIMAKNNTGAALVGWDFFVRDSDGTHVRIRFNARFSGNIGQWDSPLMIPLRSWTCIEINYNSDDVANDPTFIVDGDFVTVTQSTVPVGTYVSDVGADLYLGNIYDDNRHFYGYLENAQLFNDIQSLAESERFFNRTKNQRRLTEQKTAFFYPAPTNLCNEVNKYDGGTTGLLAAWNMIPSPGDLLVDISGQEHEINVIGGLSEEVFNILGIRTNGTSDYLTVEADKNDPIDFNGKSFTIERWFKTTDINFRLDDIRGTGALGSQVGFSIGTSGIDYGRILIDDGAGNTIQFTSAFNEDDDILHHIALTFDTLTGTAQLIIDANVKETITNANLIGANLNSGRPYRIGTESNGLTQLFAGWIGSGKVSNRVRYIQEIKDEYNRVANRVVYINDFSDEGADGVVKLPRGMIKGTGDYKINELDTPDSVLRNLRAGTKYLENSVAGTVAWQDKEAYGTWYGTLYKGADGNFWNFTFMSLNTEFVFVAGEEGYLIRVSDTEEFQLRRVINPTNSSTLFSTATSYLDNNTHYEYAIQRLPSDQKFPLIGNDVVYDKGTFAVFIRGGAFGDDGWTLVQPSGETLTNGAYPSNPVTDNTYTTSEFSVLDLDAGDQISNIVHRYGVEQ